MIKNYFVLFLANLRKMNLKYLFKLICITCFVYQSIETTLEYLEFETEVEIRVIENIKNGKMETIPAISFCKTIIPEDNSMEISLKSKNGEDFKRLGMSCEFRKDSHFDCTLSYKSFFELLNSQIFLSDYFNVIDLQHEIFECKVIFNGKQKKCEDLINITQSYDNNYKCYTFMSQLSTDSYESLNLSGYQSIDTLFFWGNYFVHDSNQLPSYSTSQMTSIPHTEADSGVAYEKVIFKRLPPPFNTNCQDYNLKIRSQAQCINDLIMKIIKKQNCLPKNFDPLTFVIKNYDYTEFKLRFCDQNFYFPETKALKKICRIACYEEIYNMKKSTLQTSTLKPMNPYFIIFESYPKLGFLKYLVDLGGLIGLWHGISFQDLNNLFQDFLRKIFSTSQLLRKLITFIEYLVVYKWLKIFIKFSQIKVNSFVIHKKYRTPFIGG